VKAWGQIRTTESSGSVTRRRGRDDGAVLVHSFGDKECAGAVLEGCSRVSTLVLDEELDASAAHPCGSVWFDAIERSVTNEQRRVRRIIRQRKEGGISPHSFLKPNKISLKT